MLATTGVPDDVRPSTTLYSLSIKGLCFTSISLVRGKESEKKVHSNIPSIYLFLHLIIIYTVRDIIKTLLPHITIKVITNSRFLSKLYYDVNKNVQVEMKKGSICTIFKHIIPFWVYRPISPLI
jgi:hypothetical protein